MTQDVLQITKRKLAKLSWTEREEVAKRAGFHVRTLARLLSAESDPHWLTLFNIAKAMETPRERR